MKDVQEPSASLCNGSQDTDTENQENEDILVVDREMRAGFTVSFSSHDMRFSNVEEKQEVEEKKEGTEESSPMGVLKDCTVSLDSEAPPFASPSNTLESETASPMASTSGSEGQPNSFANNAHWPDFFRVFKRGSTRIQTSSPLKKAVPKLTRWKNKRIREAMIPALSSKLDPELYCLKSSWKNFALSELLAATNNFSSENLIGEGGYAEVYKGQLEDGQLVAIKRLTRGLPEEMTVDFLSELGVIVHVDHPNVAKLIGYGVEGGMHLVLELSAHGSLASLLYGPKEKLDWRIRYKIALGTAEGLVYLHEECQRRIIHKDIKATNILLTEDFEPQISDFGLAKWLPEEWTHHTVSKVEGTFGYLPPEFFMHGMVDEKTDVYAYGVLLLELITGRQALDSSQQSLVIWAKPLLMNNNIEELVDPTLANAYDSEQMNHVVCTASMCIHHSPTERPQMSQVVQILKGAGKSLMGIKQCQKSKLRGTYSDVLINSEEDNSTNDLNDLNRHMEVVFGHCNGSSEAYNSTKYLNDPKQPIKVALGHTES